MARTPQDITEKELAVLQILWDDGPSTIRYIRDALYPQSPTTTHYATVQKLLDRLEEKFAVSRDRTQNVHVFRAMINRDALIGQRLQTMAEELCGGSWTPLLTNLVQNQKLSDKDRKQLRQLIDQLDPTPEQPASTKSRSKKPRS
ncbi:MAG: BlaI/MecI/CopY family transcriptional regulator [Gemmataceae bacterium]